MTGPRRLGGAGDRFGLVIKSGRSVSDGSFVIAYRPGSPGPGALGVAAGKKLGIAVIRNRIRRRVREAVRTHSDWMPDGVEAVIICRAGSIKLSHAELIQSLSRLWRRVSRQLGVSRSDSRCEPQQAS